MKNKNSGWYHANYNDDDNTLIQKKQDYSSVSALASYRKNLSMIHDSHWTTTVNDRLRCIRRLWILLVNYKRKTEQIWISSLIISIDLISLWLGSFGDDVTINCVIHYRTRQLWRNHVQNDIKLVRYRYIHGDIHDKSRKQWYYSLLPLGGALPVE